MSRRYPAKHSFLSAEYITNSSSDESSRISSQISLSKSQNSTGPVAKSGPNTAYSTKKRKISKTAPPDRDSSSDSGSGTEVLEQTGGVEETDSDDAGEDERPTPAEKSKMAKEPRPVISRLPATRFAPPSGFKPLKASGSSLPYLRASELEGKQVWHITASSRIPLNSIKEFALELFSKEEPVRGLDNKLYTFIAGPTSNKSLLIPILSGEHDVDDDNSLVYVPSPIKISRTYHVSEVVSPSMSTSSTETVSFFSNPTGFTAQPPTNDGEVCAGLAKRCTIPQQPLGLLMRCHPFGTGDVSAERLGDPDSDTLGCGDEGDATVEDLHTNFHVPDEIDSPVRKTRLPESPPAKRSKKKKTKHHQPRPEAPPDAIDNDEIGTPIQPGNATSPSLPRPKERKTPRNKALRDGDPKVSTGSPETVKIKKKKPHKDGTELVRDRRAEAYTAHASPEKSKKKEREKKGKAS